jgi:hypothetical protein
VVLALARHILSALGGLLLKPSVDNDTVHMRTLFRLALSSLVEGAGAFESYVASLDVAIVDVRPLPEGAGSLPNHLPAIRFR